MRIEKSIDIEVDIDDFDTDELIEALGDKDLTDDDRKELLRLSGYNHLDIVRNEFESSNSSALRVLQDLLSMSHCTTREQVIEEIETII